MMKKLDMTIIISTMILFASMMAFIGADEGDLIKLPSDFPIVTFAWLTIYIVVICIVFEGLRTQRAGTSAAIAVSIMLVGVIAYGSVRGSLSNAPVLWIAIVVVAVVGALASRSRLRLEDQPIEELEKAAKSSKVIAYWGVIFLQMILIPMALNKGLRVLSAIPQLDSPKYAAIKKSAWTAIVISSTVWIVTVSVFTAILAYGLIEMTVQ